jgi:tripartite-type tricarboxylate transporter receptor subunit TctC
MNQTQLGEENPMRGAAQLVLLTFDVRGYGCSALRARLSIIKKLGASLTIVASMSICCAVDAQEFPSKTIRLIVPYPAGGGVDTLSRAVAAKISAGLGQAIIVENRGGASGNIGTEAAARAAPDGYTLLATDNGIMTMNPHGFRNLPFDPLRDFQPISLIAMNNFILTVNPQTVPATDINQFFSYVRANPGKVTYASNGLGGVMHIWTEMLARKAGLSMLHVPYRGTAPALQDLVGGRVDVFLNTYSSVGPFIESGQIRPLAVTMKEPLPNLPRVPTLVASGMDFDVFGWIGIVAPAGTPKSVVDRFRDEIVKALPDLRLQFANLGSILAASTSQELSDLIRRDLDRWEPIMKELNIQFN